MSLRRSTRLAQALPMSPSSLSSNSPVLKAAPKPKRAKSTEIPAAPKVKKSAVSPRPLKTRSLKPKPSAHSGSTVTVVIPVLSTPTPSVKAKSGEDSALLTAALAHLSTADPKLVAHIARKTPSHVFGPLEAGKRQPTVFASLAKSIIYQQIHGKAAASICRRFIELFQPPAGDGSLPTKDDGLNAQGNEDRWSEGEDNFPAFEQVARMTVADLRPAGLSERKATYILDLAERFNSGEINPVTLVDMSDAEISKLLCRVKGIGQWTVDMFLIFYLKRLDVFPVLDFGVRKGMRLHFDLPAESKGKRKAGTTPEDLISLAEQWKPYRSVAAWYMWQVCDIKTVAD
ncbi:hypothetical protein H4R33_004845 [Dimargaris cristalligena]|nr:hypothetical protein H4R33_004845 [Dimargaris cristalligena]